jgi:hypothetical protein
MPSQTRFQREFVARDKHPSLAPRFDRADFGWHRARVRTIDSELRDDVQAAAIAAGGLPMIYHLRQEALS